MKTYIGKSIVSLKKAPGGTEIVDEGLYGMEAEVTGRQDGWLKLRMFYGYEGWVPEDGVVFRKTERTDVRKIQVVRASFADVKAQPRVQAETLLCVPRGAWLMNCGTWEEEEWLPVQLFCGRCGYVPRTAVTESVRETGEAFRRLPVPEQRKRLTETALSYLGTPYRWGGKTSLGNDCSGLAQMTYLLNGLIIYRDAQIKPGYPVRKIPLKDIQPGDLLYFPGHMAIYLGNQDYVHVTAAPDRHCVTVNSLNPASPGYRSDLARSLTAAGSIYV